MALGAVAYRSALGRRAVANAISARRRKGTLWQLEDYARDVAHWPAQAVEFYRKLCVAVNLDHPQPDRAATADLHSARMLADLDGPHDPFTHLGDVHSLGNEESPGRYNIPAVGLLCLAPAPLRREIDGCVLPAGCGRSLLHVLRAWQRCAALQRGGADFLWALEDSSPGDATSTSVNPHFTGADKSLWISCAALGRVRRCARASRRAS